jgi:hypothetical protein
MRPTPLPDFGIINLHDPGGIARDNAARRDTLGHDGVSADDTVMTDG